MYLDKENKNKSITHGPYDQVCGWRENIMTCLMHSPTIPSNISNLHRDSQWHGWIKQGKRVKVRLKNKTLRKCYGAN